MNRNGIPLLEELTVERLISAFYYVLPAGFDYDGEEHPGWEFVYVEQGNVEIQAGQEAYVLHRGEMVCHQPFEFHRLRSYGAEASVIIVCFTCKGQRMDWFRNKILRLGQRQKQYLSDIAAHAAELLLPKSPLEISRDGGMERAPGGTVAQEQTVKNSLELLALSLLEQESTERKERVERYEQHLHRRNLTRDIIAYLQNNLQNPIRLEDLSRRFSYSLSSVRRIFKDETGLSVMEYLTQLRMDRAKKLLRQTSMSVEAVATAVGYSNVYYFSNAFKNCTGKSPTAYRK